MMYDLKLETMSLTELHDEANRLQKMLIDGRPSPGMTSQIMDYLNQVEEKISEVNYVNRFRASQKDKPSVIEIGETQEEVYTPDYSKQELLDALVFEYTTGDKSEKNTNGEEN